MIRGAYLTVAVLIAFTTIVSAESFTRNRRGVFAGSEYDETLNIKPGEQLTVNSASTLAGTITITAGASTARLVYRKLLKVDTKKEAAEFAKVITVDMGRGTGGPLISLRAPGNAPWSGTNKSGRLELEIFLPDGCALLLNTSYFDIAATGPFTRLSISESLSKINVSDVTEATDIKVSNRDLTASKLRGEVMISNKYGRIKLSDVDTGEETGSVRNEHAAIVIDNYSGGLDARTSYDFISADGLLLTGTRNRIKNVSAPISLGFHALTEGKIRINNQYGQISVDIAGETIASFICKNPEKGRVIVENMFFEPTLVYDNRLEFKVGEGEGAELRLTAKDGGDIIIKGSEENVQVGGSGWED